MMHGCFGHPMDPFQSHRSSPLIVAKAITQCSLVRNGFPACQFDSVQEYESVQAASNGSIGVEKSISISFKLSSCFVSCIVTNENKYAHLYRVHNYRSKCFPSALLFTL